MVAADQGAATLRAWIPDVAQRREATIAAVIEPLGTAAIHSLVDGLISRNRHIHERECINLNPATNIMNPLAEAALASGLGSRPSLGYAGDKYEMGLEAIEEIEVITSDLARRVFAARHVELRVASGSMANLYAFMATCRPGDSIIVPPASIGGHVTHNTAGAAGLYGLDIHEAPINAHLYTIDAVGLRELAQRVQPKLITVGASLNLTPHPVEEIRAVADEVGAFVLFDAAHACGMIAGHVWANPLAQGADLMTMSTYKSLGGPAGGLVFTNRDDIAERLDSIAYPGLTANFDVATTASLAISLLDWIDHGDAYAAAMVTNASALAQALLARDIPVFTTSLGPTTTHQFAVDARGWGGGHAAAQRLRDANLLASAIGLPFEGGMPGLRLGTPEVTRLGLGMEDMLMVAGLINDALRGDPTSVAARTTALRSHHTALRYVRTG